MRSAAWHRPAACIHLVAAMRLRPSACARPLAPIHFLKCASSLAARAHTLPGLLATFCLPPQIKGLQGQVDHFREAHATVSREMEARLAEAQGASAKLATVGCAALRFAVLWWAALPCPALRCAVWIWKLASQSRTGCPKGCCCAVCAAPRVHPQCPPTGQSPLASCLLQVEAESAELVRRLIDARGMQPLNNRVHAVNALQVEAESAELVRRLIELKDREADRMNEINRLEAETVRGSAAACVCS